MAGWLLFLLVVLFLVGIILLAVLVHAGYFTTVRIRTSIPSSLPTRVVYTVFKGPYSKAYVPLSELTARAPKQTAFCIFYDDPKKVPEGELRSVIGCSLPDTTESPLEKALKASGYSVWTFPKCNRAVITEFPTRSFLSCMIAPGIVYPALIKYFEELDLKCVGPIVEVYIDGCTQYVAPLEKNEGFFVPEIAKQQESKKKQ